MVDLLGIAMPMELPCFLLLSFCILEGVYIMVLMLNLEALFGLLEL